MDRYSSELLHISRPVPRGILFHQFRQKRSHKVTALEHTACFLCPVSFPDPCDSCAESLPEMVRVAKMTGPHPRD
ncbi:hypothetical protein RRG08_028258 [Elysia crispata]|uniref:Uncharacterized protein n=1 Tax=Elysia crispata TaxID=231223 RepID=A0AAE0ZJ31_9GAST|nr:hypothetical protein RRG08_028258 [Elysia crispata]